MIDSIKLWVRSFYSSVQTAVRGLRELSLRLHDESGKIEGEAKRLRDAEQRKHDEELAARIRAEANHYLEEAERLERDLEEAMKQQPHDKKP